MAIIKFTAADVLRGKVMEDGWYNWLICDVKGPYENKNKDSNNIDVTFRLINSNTDYDGKEVKRVFSFKALSMFIPLYAAVKGLKIEDVKPEDFVLDTDEFMGAKVDGFVKSEIYQGTPNNRVEEYAPLNTRFGKAAGSTNF